MPLLARLTENVDVRPLRQIRLGDFLVAAAGMAIGAAATAAWFTDRTRNQLDTPVSISLRNDEVIPAIVETNTISSDLSPQDAAPVEQALGRSAQRGRSVPRLTLVGLTTLLLIGGLAIAYRAFIDVAAVPSPRPDPGKVYLFFDQPGVPAYLETRVAEEGSDETQLRHRIQIDDGYANESIRYFLVSVGDARTGETYPNGESSVQANGCWASLWSLPDDGLRCRTARLKPGSVYSTPEAREPAQVVTGIITRDSLTKVMTVDVTTYTDAVFNVKAGKRRYFTLPAVGTSYVPPAYRQKLSFDLEDGQRGYVPAKLDVAVVYKELAESDRLENVAPNPVLPGSLSWVEIDESLLRARGSIVDTVAEERGQRALFLIGLYAGLAASILPILATQFLRLARLTRRRPSHR
jgi:hypothetical protein